MDSKHFTFGSKKDIAQTPSNLQLQTFNRNEPPPTQSILKRAYSTVSSKRAKSGSTRAKSAIQRTNSLVKPNRYGHQTLGQNTIITGISSQNLKLGPKQFDCELCAQNEKLQNENGANSKCAEKKDFANFYCKGQFLCESCYFKHLEHNKNDINVNQDEVSEGRASKKVVMESGSIKSLLTKEFHRWQAINETVQKLEDDWQNTYEANKDILRQIRSINEVKQRRRVDPQIVDPEKLPAIIDILKQEIKNIQQNFVLPLCKQNDLQSLYELRGHYNKLQSKFTEIKRRCKNPFFLGEIVTIDVCNSDLALQNPKISQIYFFMQAYKVQQSVSVTNQMIRSLRKTQTKTNNHTESQLNHDKNFESSLDKNDNKDEVIRVNSSRHFQQFKKEILDTTLQELASLVEDNTDEMMYEKNIGSRKQSLKNLLSVKNENQKARANRRSTTTNLV